MTTDKKRIGILVVRVSKNEQLEGTSLEAQERAGRNIATNNKIELPFHTLREEGISGTTTDRKALKTVMQHAKRKEITHVIFRNTSRFSRNHRKGIEYAYKLWDHGVRIITSELSFNLDNIMSKMNLNNYLIMAEHENEERSGASAGSKYENLLNGIYSLGSPPLGTKKNDEGALEIIPGYDAIIRDIYSVFLAQPENDAYGYAKTAHVINSKYGLNLQPNQIKKFLTNIIYAGYVMLMDQRIEYPSTRIVTEKIFNKAQRKVQKIYDKYSIGTSKTPPVIINQAIKYGLDFLKETYTRAIALRCPICGGKVKLAGWREYDGVYVRRVECMSGCGKHPIPNASQLSKIKNKADLICPVCGNSTGIESEDCKHRVNAALHRCSICDCHFIIPGSSNRYLLQAQINKKRKKRNGKRSG